MRFDDMIYSLKIIILYLIKCTKYVVIEKIDPTESNLF